MEMNYKTVSSITGTIDAITAFDRSGVKVVESKSIAVVCFHVVQIRIII